MLFKLSICLTECVCPLQLECVWSPCPRPYLGTTAQKGTTMKTKRRRILWGNSVLGDDYEIQAKHTHTHTHTHMFRVCKTIAHQHFVRIWTAIPKLVCRETTLASCWNRYRLWDALALINEPVLYRSCGHQPCKLFCKIEHASLMSWNKFRVLFQR